MAAISLSIRFLGSVMLYFLYLLCPTFTEPDYWDSVVLFSFCWFTKAIKRRIDAKIISDT